KFSRDLQKRRQHPSNRLLSRPLPINLSILPRHAKNREHIERGQIVKNIEQQLALSIEALEHPWLIHEIRAPKNLPISLAHRNGVAILIPTHKVTNQSGHFIECCRSARILKSRFQHQWEGQAVEAVKGDQPLHNLLFEPAKGARVIKQCSVDTLSRLRRA